jgi:PhzF family phenazine biosynthesis protein
MRRFQQVDVFGAQPFRGNPVAVVLDAQGLTDAQMQAVARWTNLSETTFVLPPVSDGADYRVRIFTPGQELPFAGHPTLGTAHAWLAAGGEAGDEVVQECGAGLVRVKRGQTLAFEAPPIVRSGPVADEQRARVLHALGVGPDEVLDVQWVDNGPGWVAVLLADAEAVLAVAPRDLDGFFIGVVGPGPEFLEVRAFFDANGVCTEDPVTGSLNASVAQWLVDRAVVEFPYVARQGTALGRDGRVHVSRDQDGSIWVGGSTVTCVSGSLEV